MYYLFNARTTDVEHINAQIKFVFFKCDGQNTWSYGPMKHPKWEKFRPSPYLKKPFESTTHYMFLLPTTK